MKRFAVFSLLAWVILTTGLSNAQAQWSRLRIARGWDQGYGVAIGKGRNDDTIRVYYGGNKSGLTPALFECTYHAGGWETTSTYVDYVGQLTVGDARNDGVQRVYYIRFGPGELSYVGGSWVRDTLVRSGRSGGIAVGSARNDGRNRLYVSGIDDGHMYEYEYVTDHWVMTDMGATGGGAELRRVVLGQGRNDGIVRIYAVHLNGHVYEYSYEGGSWVINDLGPYLPGVGSNGGIAIGDGRNDGLQRLYVSMDTLGTSNKGIIVEYSYEGGNWVKRWVGNNWIWFEPLAVGRGRNDSLNRVYGASVDSHVYEFSYQGGQWVKADIGAGETNIYGPADMKIGAGRGDGVNRVYAVNDADLYEFSWTGSAVEQSEDKRISQGKMVRLFPNHPNPFRDRTELSYELPERKEVSLRIYDCAGRLVKRLMEGHQEAGWHRCVWDGRGGEGGYLPAGVYFCQLVSKGEKKGGQTVKLVLTR